MKITFYLAPDMAAQIKDGASADKISQSKYVSKLLDSALKPHDDTELTRLREELAEVKRNFAWLQNEYSVLSQRLLPAPKKSIWDRFRRKK